MVSDANAGCFVILRSRVRTPGSRHLYFLSFLLFIFIFLDSLIFSVPVTSQLSIHSFLYISDVKVVESAFLAHLSRRLTRWTFRMGLEPASVRASVRASTLSNMNISETSRPITTKFYLKHHWGGGKAALGFDADQIRTLVSMATDSSHRVIMGKRVSSRFLDCFWSDPFYTCR